LEKLATDDRIPIEHYAALQNCETNEEGGVLMDVSDYREDAIRATVECIDLRIVRQGEGTLLIQGEFGDGPDTY
jgi:hypothetical protein